MLIDLINRAFTETGLSKTAFAAALDLNKSFVLRVMSGKKKPSEKFIEGIYNLDSVSNETKAAINEEIHNNTFTPEAMGDIRCFLEHLNNFEASLNVDDSIFIRDDILERVLFGDEFVYRAVSENEILEIACFLAKRAVATDSCFISNFDASMTKLPNLLYPIFRDAGHRIKGKVFRIANCRVEDIRSSVDVLFAAARLGNLGVQTYVRPGNDRNADDLFPEFIITDEAVMIFDRKLSKALVFTDKASIQAYRDGFENIRSKYVPLCRFVDNEFTLYEDGSLVNDKLVCSIDGTSSMLNYLDFESADAIAAPDLPRREFMIQAILSGYVTGLEKSGHCRYVTKKSLRGFAQYGRLNEISPKHASAVPHEYRKRMFENMKRPRIHTRLLNDAKLDPCKRMTLYIYRSKLILILFFPGDNDFVSVNIEVPFSEDRLMEMLMKNLVSYLERSDYCHDRHYMTNVIDDCILWCEHAPE